MLLAAPATQLDKVNQKPIAYLIQPKSAGRESPVLSASKRGLANSPGGAVGGLCLGNLRSMAWSNAKGINCFLNTVSVASL